MQLDGWVYVIRFLARIIFIPVPAFRFCVFPFSYFYGDAMKSGDVCFGYYTRYYRIQFHWKYYVK